MTDAPIPMRLVCPQCYALHIDEGEFATKPHHTHACQSCGEVWRPAIVATVGVQFLPGFKNTLPKFITDAAKEGEPPTFSIADEPCPECGHNHAGAEVGGICIGCPCAWRPSNAG